MEVFRASVYYKTQQGLNVVNLAAACPSGESPIGAFLKYGIQPLRS